MLFDNTGLLIKTGIVIRLLIATIVNFYKVYPVPVSHRRRAYHLCNQPILASATLSRPMMRYHLFTAVIISVAMLGGCADPKTSKADATNNSDNASINADNVKDSENNQTKSAKTDALTDTTGKLQIDWSMIDSGVKAVDKNSFEYPFALHSQPVKSYMEFFNVDAKTAQYNLTVGMASNEALSRVLDQLSNHYVSHELTDGENFQLVIHTTEDVAASQYDYILADPFAKGLTLPIVIQPDGKKPASD